MISLDTIRKPVAESLTAFDQFVVEQFTAQGELLSDMLRYALESRGKGIRPLLVMLSASLNSPVEGRAVGRRTHLAAMLVEMVHVASLIHDDVIDESNMRRGKASVNARWQSHKAVVLGDYILARNFSIGLHSGQFDLVSHVCDSITTLCEGEVLQSDRAEKHYMSREDYLDIIRKKTASLIGVSASAGAMSVGASQERVSQMRRFGEAVGMAFQIQDDILDYTRTAQTGKPTNNDLREGKITLPLLVVLERLSPERRDEMIAKLALCHSDDQALEYLQLTVENAGGIEGAASVMQKYLEQAVAILADYQPSEYRTSLVNLCAYIAQRDR